VSFFASLFNKLQHRLSCSPRAFRAFGFFICDVCCCPREPPALAALARFTRVVEGPTICVILLA